MKSVSLTCFLCLILKHFEHDELQVLPKHRDTEQLCKTQRNNDNSLERNSMQYYNSNMNSHDSVSLSLFLSVSVSLAVRSGSCVPTHSWRCTAGSWSTIWAHWRARTGSMCPRCGRQSSEEQENRMRKMMGQPLSQVWDGEMSPSVFNCYLAAFCACQWWFTGH